MNTEISVEDMSFLQLSDSFFPTGLYTTSNGVEFIFREKKLKSRDILKLIKVYLKQQVGPADCVALGNAYDCAERSDLQGLIEVDQTLYSMRLVDEIRNASVRSGIQLLRCTRFFVTQNKILKLFQQSVTNGHASGIYPMSFAVVCKSLNIPKHKTGLMLLYGFVVSIIGAALRLGILQHFDGQKIIHELKSFILVSVKENIDKPLSSIWQFAPAIDIIQMKHEQMDSRMFIT
ncbi:MAG: urease accessory protein [Thaumarchaeota archaeon]|nr:MAG: urease accessory protein [Nitrososphaerota archaeon]